MNRGVFRHRAADGGGKATMTGNTKVEFSAACVSDVGRSRSHNEDSFGEDFKLGLWVVADGMGGHEAGEVASDLAVSHIFRLVSDGMPVAEAVSSTHELIRRAPSQGIGAPGMGTTVVAAQLSGRSYRICWVGDSRAYVHGSIGLRPLTSDHSYVQQLLDSGVITAEEAEVHPERSVITQCLGAEGLPRVQVSETAGELNDGEVLLLCSDGLTGEVSEAEIAAILGEETTIGEKAQRLVDTANANGGSDNITVALIPAPADTGRQPMAAATRKIRSITVGTKGSGRKWRRVVGWAVAGVVIAAIVTAGWLWRAQVLKFAENGIAYIKERVGDESTESEAPSPVTSPERVQGETREGKSAEGQGKLPAPNDSGDVTGEEGKVNSPRAEEQKDTSEDSRDPAEILKY